MKIKKHTGQVNDIPQIKFDINFEEDLKYTLGRLSLDDPAGLEYRLKNSQMDEDRINQILNSTNKEVKMTILKEYLSEYYLKHRQEMASVCISYQKIWDSISTNFFSSSNQIFLPFNWKFNDYSFLVSAFYSHGSWGDTNRLATKWSRDPNKYYFLNAFELLLTHFFESIDQKYKTRPIENWKIWALAEATAYILTYKVDSVRKAISPTLTEPSSFNYPQLLKPIADLSIIFENRNGFDDYIEKSVEYIQKYSVDELKNNPQK